MEPCWEAALARKDQEAAYEALVCLAAADPIGVLQKLETEDITTPLRVAEIKFRVAQALARSDLARAEKVAESIDSPETRSGTSGRWPTRCQSKRTIVSLP